MPQGDALRSVFARPGREILEAWIAQQTSSGRRPDPPDDALRSQAAELIELLKAALAQGDPEDLEGEEWTAVRDCIASIARARAAQGLTPSQAAAFVVSLKQFLFSSLRDELTGRSESLADELWLASCVLDRLGLHAVEVVQHCREEAAARRHEELMQLSSPVLKPWEGILVLPIIGPLDDGRMRRMTETLLHEIAAARAEVAIIDIHSVTTIDAVIAQLLLKTVAAARLMGAECIVSGIRPQIAQTLAQLGVDPREVTTKATLAAAFALALQRIRATLPGTAGGS